jgi:hypothetical protein
MPDTLGFVIPKISNIIPFFVFSDTIRAAGDGMAGAAEYISLRQPAGGNGDESDRALSTTGPLGLSLMAPDKNLAVFLFFVDCFSFWRSFLNEV